MEQLQDALRQMNERQRLLEEQLAQAAARNADLENRLSRQEQASASSTLPPPPPGAPRPMSNLFGIQGLGKPDKFSGEDSKWKDWCFVTRSFLVASIPSSQTGLEQAENSPTVDVRNINVNDEAARVASLSVYFALTMLTCGRALDRVQSAGVGEGYFAWRTLCDFWQPKTRSRFIGLLLRIIMFKMGGSHGSVLDGLETWKRMIRDFEQQTTFSIPDFIKIGLLVSNLLDDRLREHLLVHGARLDAFSDIDKEIRDITLSQSQFIASDDPMLVDALHPKGGGKRKKDKGKGGKGGKPTQTDKPNDKDVECFYCKKKGHRKSECRKLKADLAAQQKAKGGNRGTADSLVQPSNASGDAAPAAAGNTSYALVEMDFPTGPFAPAYLFPLFDGDELGFLNSMLMVDSGCSRSTCPPSHAAHVPVTFGETQGPLHNASGVPVVQHGQKRVGYRSACFDFAVDWNVADVQFPMLSSGAMASKGTTTIIGPLGGALFVDPSGSIWRQILELPGVQLLIEEKGVFWLEASPLEGAEADLLCTGVAIHDEEPAPEAAGIDHHNEEEIAVRRKPLPHEPSKEERERHEARGHLPDRSWCESCVVGRGKDDAHRKRASAQDGFPEGQMDYMFIGRASDDKPLTICNYVDVRSHNLTATACHKGPRDHVVARILKGINEAGRTQLVLRTDLEHSIIALANAVKNARAHGTTVETVSKKSSKSLGVVEYANGEVAAECRVLRHALEKAIGADISTHSAITAWLVEYACWALDRFCVRSDGRTAYFRCKGRPYRGEVCTFGEQVLAKDPLKALNKFEERWSPGMWLGKTVGSDDHLVKLNTQRIVAPFRSVKPVQPSKRWNKEVILALDVFPWTPPPRAVEFKPRRRYITWAMLERYGLTPGCSCCQGEGHQHSEICRSRIERLIEEDASSGDVVPKQDDAAQPASAPPASSGTGPLPENSEGTTLMDDAAFVAPPAEGQFSAGSSQPMELVVAVPPSAPDEKRKTEVSDSPLPASKRTRRIGDLSVCVAGALLQEELVASFDFLVAGWEGLAFENALLAASVAESSAPPVPGLDGGPIQVPLVERPTFGTKSGLLLPPLELQQGRQKEMDMIHRFRAIEVVRRGLHPNAKHIKADWVNEDWKDGIVRCRFGAKELNTYDRSDVCQTTPALRVFRWLVSLAATLRPDGLERFFAVWDVSVAFLHADMDEEIVVHPPSYLCPASHEWLLLKAMNGTRRASVLFANLVAKVLGEDGALPVQVLAMTFVKPGFYEVAIHGDDFGAEGTAAGMEQLDAVINKNFLAKCEGVVGPGRASSTRILKRTVSYDSEGFHWHADPKHAEAIIEMCGLTASSAKPAAVPGSKAVGKSNRLQADELEGEDVASFRSVSGTGLP